MRSKHSRVAWLAALIILLSPLASLQAAEKATEKAAEKAPEKASESAAKPAESSATAPAAKTDASASEAKADAKAEPAADKRATPGEGEQAAQAEKKSGGEANHKSPGLAGALAFFPGIAVHGAGHMYAGSWIKGLGLLAIEGAAAGFAVSAINSGINDVQKLSDGTKNGAIPTNVGTAYQTVGITLVSTMAFLWTWFDDMAGAPIAAKEYNRLADEAASQAKLQFTPNGDGAALALVKNF